MKCSRGQLRNNGACCARKNVRVRFQLRTAFRDSVSCLVWPNIMTIALLSSFVVVVLGCFFFGGGGVFCLLVFVLFCCFFYC